ncbi:TetR/AcrR family transcriptional regulator [Phenylobacterium montanum]|uniref:TetR family transcriptional regulator n=1 Tax=Phenylobacterium montanum TaxID=2823693 RepID=A0A975IWZ3_9CAUL|nr:TetR/AcrR family transcriptional regulator [Caulobacter sp. S6]QUD90408.1 TetR family transcriptional regulator [Caulobacter sp. S6]
MSASKSGPVRRNARSYGQSPGGLVQPHSAPGEGEGSEKSDVARRAILDATVACFAEHGWSGTNMSVIARRSRMTRGRIQYYFPTLDDLLRAAIDHLLAEWRRRYFSLISQASGPSARIEAGVNALWEVTQDPLHVAKQELEATARTNPELRVLLEQFGVENDEASVAAAKRMYPELAAYGDAAFRRARDFTMVFMEGLAIFRFSSAGSARQRELIEMLTEVIITYWKTHGVEVLEERPSVERLPVRDTAAVLDEERRIQALSLIKQAADLLSPQ